MHRKRRTLKLAQKYLEQHENRVSKAHLCKEELAKGWKSFLRWLSNTATYLVPWDSKIKRIESKYSGLKIATSAFQVTMALLFLLILYFFVGSYL
jgi:hypothetical protein